MALFVINEWLWADAQGSNGSHRQLQVVEFLDRFSKSDHLLIVVPGTAFDHKAWALCKSNDLVARKIGIDFVSLIRLNSDRCRLLNPDSLLSLPTDLAKKIKADDHYLVCAQLTAEGAILITTDNPLHRVLDNYKLPCLGRKEFLNSYFAINK